MPHAATPTTAPSPRLAPWSRAWHAVLAIVVATALAVDLGLILAGVPAAEPTSAPGRASRIVNYFSYFTIQSNILVVVVAASLALDPLRDGRVWRVLRLDALLGIVITGLVYGLVLSGTHTPTGVGVFTNTALHYAAPWGMLVGWVAFGPRPRITLGVVAAGFVWPLTWIGYTFAHGAATSWYPYFFLDAADLGLGPALVSTGGVLAVAALLALLLLGVERLLGRRRGDSRAPGRSVGETAPEGVPGPVGGEAAPGRR